MRVFNNPRVANATALLSLAVALSGTAYAANTVRSADIVNGEVKSKDLASNSVKSSKVKDGSLTEADLKAGTAPKTAAYAAFRDNIYNLPNVAGYITTLSLDLPSAGSYVVTGKLMLNNNDNFTMRPDCRILVGGNFDSGLVGLGSNSENDDTAVATFVVTATTAGPATALLQCQKNSVGDVVTAEQRKIIAVKVDSLVNTAQPGPARPAAGEVK